MKAKELMIGDWVFSPTGKPYKLRKSDFVNDDAWFEDCRPIPVSLERLEKNGWAISDDFAFVKNSKCDIKIDLTNQINSSISSYNGSSIYMEFQFIHQIQHALRLCGLNELADNLIVK